MNESSATGFRLAVNRTALSVYFTAGILALSIAAVYLILRERYLLLLFLPAIPVVVYLATNTRWAVYQYIFCLFFLAPFGSETSFSLVDLSGLLVLVAAAIDLFADHRLPRRFPPLFFNFILVLTAVCVAAVFAYEPILALNPISRLTMLAVTFLALYRLIDISDLGRFLRIFLWLSVLHAIAVALPFLLSAGVIRSYGLSGVAYDDLAMLTLPIGLSLFLWSRRGRSLKYLVGSFAVFCGLVATKSRASMLFALFAAAVVLAISLARARKLRRQEASDRKSPGALAEIPPVATRIAWLGLMAALVVVGTIALLPGITEAIVSRFESVVTFSTGGTVKTRIELWRSALFAFSQHPLLGVGPGSFRTLHEFLPTIHMQAMHVYVKGLSAHNLLLHYLAESGLVGALALVTLFVAQFRCGRWPWRHVGTVDHSGTDAALYVVSLLFLVTMMFEAGWLWGQFGYTFVFFAALIVRNREVAPS